MNDEIEVTAQDIEVIAQGIDQDSAGILADDWAEFAGQDTGSKVGLDKPLNRF
jgi:hypothetical protein